MALRVYSACIRLQFGLFAAAARWVTTSSLCGPEGVATSLPSLSHVYFLSLHPSLHCRVVSLKFHSGSGGDAQRVIIGSLFLFLLRRPFFISLPCPTLRLLCFHRCHGGSFSWILSRPLFSLVSR